MSRRIYESSNGDVWDLTRKDGRVGVRHTPNLASGGTATDHELGAFLSQERHSPQNMALVALIGSLVEEAAEERRPQS